MTDKPASVRVALPADEEALFWLLQRDLEDDNGLGFPASPRKVYAHVHKCCTGDGAIAGVIDGPRGIVGSVGIEFISPWYSDVGMLIQIWQFVVPTNRSGKRFGEDLFAFAEWHRQDMSSRSGQDMVLDSTVMSHKRLAAKTRLWRRHGKQVGSIFWSGGENVQEFVEQHHSGHDAGAPLKRPERL